MNYNYVRTLNLYQHVVQFLISMPLHLLISFSFSFPFTLFTFVFLAFCLTSKSNYTEDQ